jgi:glutamate-1-semialdehyde 2,1-aminomutase
MTMKEPSFSRSKNAFERAKQVIPGGVNSPVRAHKAVGGIPFFVARGEGAFVFDIDGNRYVDLVMAYGPLILGHRHKACLQAIERAMSKGLSYGMPTEEEVFLAEAIIEANPPIEMIRLVNSGTEAAMSAIRVARAFTGRANVVKFSGCYHGHADYLLVRAGSGATTFGFPDSAGVPEAFARHTITLPYNDPEALEKVFAQAGNEIACVIVEPFAGNMGVVLPDAQFVEALRTIPKRYGALLILDEVMTGFRVAWGGAWSLLKITPDLMCLGKIIGGGLPIGAYGGRKDIMKLVAPLGPCYQAGTLSGNPISVAAGLATLKVLKEENPYPALEDRTKRLADGISAIAQDLGVFVVVQRIGSMITVFFSRKPVRNYDDALSCDTHAFSVFFHAMRNNGVMMPPSQFEAMFLSVAHDEEVIEHCLDSARKALQQVKEVQGARKVA